MLQRVRLQTPDGIREYKFAQDSRAYDAAKEAGEIEIGEEMIYRSFLVHVLPDYVMLMLDKVGMPFTGPEFVPNMGGFAGGVPDMGNWQSSPDGTHWSFTMNGQPVTPEQMAQMMGGK